jgi:hypothetical protein
LLSAEQALEGESTEAGLVIIVMEEDRLDIIYERLQHLQKLDTVSDFSKAFYALIAEQLATADASGAHIAIAFADFLAAEGNYHRRLAVLGDENSLAVGDLQALAERRRLNLQGVVETIVCTAASSTQLRAIQHLLLAECYYHQCRTPEVVEQLRLAIECGMREPIVQFALGYNIYSMALELYATLGDDENGVIVTDHVAFQNHCLSAIAVLESSLSGEPFDVQVYWWLAHVMDAAGMADAARDIEDILGRMRDESTAHVSDAGFPSERAEAVAAPDFLPQITADEVREAGQLLQGRFSLADVLGHDPGDE